MAHVHPAYHKQLLTLFDASLTAPTNFEDRVKATASWDAAVEATKRQWAEEGMTGYAGSIKHVSPNRLTSRPQSLRETSQKSWYDVLDVLKSNSSSDIHEEVIEFAAMIKAKNQGRIINRNVVINQQQVSLAAPNRRLSSKRKTMAADHQTVKRSQRTKAGANE